MYKRVTFIEGKHYHVDKETGCWIWLQALNTKGYATTSINSITKLASRVFYEINNGEIKRGCVLDHLCRNIKCVNPAHLEPVTYAINTRRGLLTKLSDYDVDFIRKSTGRTQKELGKMFGVTQSNISKIINNKSYVK